MGDIAVRVENLSKLYRIGAKQESYKTFRDSITDAVTAPFKRVAGLLRGNAAAAANLNETIWALKDVSFEVKKGEVVGIIGRNGAGKSTLLKILSRITEPTSGEAKVYGRVGALLEVGTGFHPELTGRENIYLNGAILGMSREEIKRKFDEIVAFAEVEKFIDTPVKHYSSGMGLRLGFAVAAHLEPEILIVDEVLAVGDAAFQKKCLGKMGEVAGEGRTVLFVSHNMAAVKNLCTRGILFNDGMKLIDGNVEKCIFKYLGDSGAGESLEWIRTDEIVKSAALRIIRLEEKGTPLMEVFTSTALQVFIEFELAAQLSDIQLGVGLLDEMGVQILGSAPQDGGCTVPHSPGIYRMRVSFPKDMLMPRSYVIRVALWNKLAGTIDGVNAVSFQVQKAPSLGTIISRPGLVAIHCTWELMNSIDKSPDWSV